MGSADKNRQDNKLSFVLHTYPFRETSLLVDIFSRELGRLTLVARGARRPRSETRGVLMPFQPLLISWFGKTELRTLHKVEWVGGQKLLPGSALMNGFYINELMMRLVPRDDPIEHLFDFYQATVRRLGDEPQQAAAILRKFELVLLQELGYGLLLEQEAGGKAIDPDRFYDYFIEQGPVLVPDGRQTALHVRGQTLLDMAAERYQDPSTVQESKLLMRSILSHYLGGKPLHTPQLIKDLLSL